MHDYHKAVDMVHYGVAQASRQGKRKVTKITLVMGDSCGYSEESIRGKALGRTDILNKVWGEGYFGEEKIVDVNVRRLRMKIEEEPSAPKHIITVWGLGYKWQA